GLAGDAKLLFLALGCRRFAFFPLMDADRDNAFILVFVLLNFQDDAADAVRAFFLAGLFGERRRRAQRHDQRHAKYQHRTKQTHGCYLYCGREVFKNRPARHCRTPPLPTLWTTFHLTAWARKSSGAVIHAGWGTRFALYLKF